MPSVRLLLKIAYDAPDELAAALDGDLGRGGIFVHTDFDLPIGTELSLSLSLPELTKAIEIHGIVRRRGPSGRGGSDAMGLHIQFLDDQAVALAQLHIATTAARRSSTTAIKDRSFRVLVAEDNAFVRELFRHALTKFQAELGCDKYEILIARDGDEALRIVEGAPVDIAILDHFLPGLTGNALVRKMRAAERYRQTPILVVSAGGEEVREEAHLAGATLFLQKPVLLTQLLDTLRGLLLNNQANAS